MFKMCVSDLSKMSGTAPMIVGFRIVASPMWPLLIFDALSVSVFALE